MSIAYDSPILYYYYYFIVVAFILSFFWQAHNICVPLTNKVYRSVQKRNRKGWRGRGNFSTHTQHTHTQGDRWVTHTSKQWRAECVFGKGLPLVCVSKRGKAGKGAVGKLQATSWSRSTANVHRQQLPNEIVYGKPQCEKCHLFAKMSKAKGRARFRRTTDSTRRHQTEMEREGGGVESSGAKTSADVVCGAGKRQTEAAYWAMAAPQAEMSQLGCHMRR